MTLMRDARSDPETGTPVLIGRDDLLALSERRAAAVVEGRGHVLFLAGEAGIGKTRLLGAVEAVLGTRGFRVARAAAVPGDLELAGALFEDLARRARRAAGPDAVTGEAIEERLRRRDTDGDAHRQRRLLVLDLTDLVLGLSVDQPVLLSLEDLHWADDLTLEVLSHVARGVQSRPVLVVGTYRSDELFPRTPMREWRSRLVTARLAEEARLARFSRSQTGDLVAALAPAETLPTALVDAIHDRSDGIPLHVEELLGALRAAADQASVVPGLGGTAGVPGTLAEAVLGRLGPMDDQVRLVVSTAAVIGRSFDLELLAACTDLPMDGLAQPIGWLQGRFVVLPTSDGRGYDFRHALIRDALYEDIPLPARRVLHGRVADVIARAPGPADDAGLSMHYERAGRAEEASQHALRAGRRASSMSAHREALDLYRRALTNLSPDAPAVERATLLTAVGDEAAAVDRNQEAAESYAEARRLLVDEGRPADAADLVPRLVAARHLLGDDLAARVALIEQGLAEARSAGASPRAQGIRARLAAALAAALMLARRLRESILQGQVARELAAAAGDDVTGLNASATLASCLVFAGEGEDGWMLHQRTIDGARAAGQEAEAARAYRMAGSCASVLVRYPDGERWLREGIDYAERCELWNHRHYMAAHLAHVAWATGDWDTARSVAEHVLADGRGGITTRITALHVLGYVALGRGHGPAADTALEEAQELGEAMRELQRLSPALWGLAESALLRGDAGRAVELSDAGYRASAAVDDAAYLYPFLVTGTRARLGAGDPLAAERWVTDVAGILERVGIIGTLPAVSHARGLLALAAGQTRHARIALEEARQGWLDRGRIWEGTWGALDLARCASRTNRAADAARLAGEAKAVADRLGSPPLQDAAAPFLGGRSSAAPGAPWAPLTAREYEVARFVADGWTDPEIGAELGLSPRTVGSHVTHILDKLSVPRRTGIAAWVATVTAAGPHPPR